MERNGEKQFSIKLNGTGDKVLLEGIEGYSKTICFPSAMWPVPGRNTAVLTEGNTVPCTDTAIRHIFDTLPFLVGRCYQNAELLAEALRAEGIPAKTYCGWLLYSATIPTHHAAVLIGEDQLLDPSTLNFTQIPPVTEPLPADQVREKFAEWVLEQQKRPRSEVYTFGQVFPGHIYIMAELAPQKAIAVRQKLERAYPKHPAFAGPRADGYTDMQIALKKGGMV